MEHNRVKKLSTISVVVIGLFLIAAKAKDPIVVPVAGEQYLTLKDLNEIKVMFFGYLVGLISWLLKTLYDIFIKKSDSAENKIDDLIEKFDALSGKVDRMSGKFEYLATKNEVQDMIREDITFYDGLRKKERE